MLEQVPLVPEKGNRNASNIQSYATQVCASNFKATVCEITLYKCVGQLFTFLDLKIYLQAKCKK